MIKTSHRFFVLGRCLGLLLLLACLLPGEAPVLRASNFDRVPALGCFVSYGEGGYPFIEILHRQELGDGSVVLFANIFVRHANRPHSIVFQASGEQIKDGRFQALSASKQVTHYTSHINLPYSTKYRTSYSYELFVRGEDLVELQGSCSRTRISLPEGSESEESCRVHAEPSALKPDKGSRCFVVWEG